MWLRNRTVLSLMFVVIAVTGVTMMDTREAHGAEGYPSLGYPRCRHEDGYGQRVCVWQGDRQGNKIGHSLIIRGDHVRVITHKQAHRLVRAWRLSHR